MAKKPAAEVGNSEALLDPRELPPVLDGKPDEVAERLIGTTIKIGRKQGTILKVLPQDQEDNAQWLDRPLFWDPPVDAYIASYRGGLLLFLRTGAEDSCVRIDAIEAKGEKHDRPTQVCKALGIEDESWGWVSYDDDQQAIKVSWY